jgi:hypothetical protein
MLCYAVYITNTDGDNDRASTTCDETLLQALDDLSNQDAFNINTIDNLNQPKSSYKLFYSNINSNNNKISSGISNDDSGSGSNSGSGKKKSKSRSSSITSFTNSLSTSSFFNNRSKEREAAILETLEIAQQRIVHLVIELDNAKEANAIVLETKESVLRSLARQNTILTIEVSIVVVVVLVDLVVVVM